MKPHPSTFLLAVWLAALAPVQAEPALKDAFQQDFLVGAALNAAQFTGANAGEASMIRRQFNTISPEDVLKWESVHPRPGVYDFSLADRYVAFGETNHMFIVGHNLVWHEETPRWVFQQPDGRPVDRDTLLACLSNHIQTVVGRYRGRIAGWDVVNEAVGEDGALRPTPWLQIIGPDYLVKAYQWAHAADPRMELYYNDYGLEDVRKRSGALELVRRLQAAGIHLTAVGLQEHVRLDWPSTGAIADTITAFSRLGVKVNVTELDVDVLPAAFTAGTADVSLQVARRAELNPYPDGLPEAVQAALARRYAALFSVYVQHHQVMERVTFWGVEDGDSWLNNWPVRGRTNYPLLFDRAGHPKPAFSSVLAAARPDRVARHDAGDAGGSMSVNQP